MPDAVAFLSDEWVAALAEVAASVPARPGASATVTTVVTGGPVKERAYRWTVSDGRVVAAEPGGAAEGAVDIVVNQPYDDAVADLSGEYGIDVAFMRGSTKVVGRMGTFMDLLPVLRSPEWDAARRQLRERTAL